MIALVVIVAVIVVAAAGALVLLGGNGSQGNNGRVLKVGDFLTYQATFNINIPNIPITNITYEILGINATSIYFKQTSTSVAGTQVYYYNETRNETLFDFDPSHPWSSATFTYVGKATIDTRWGAKSADNYSISSNGSINLTGNWWIYNGIPLKAYSQWNTIPYQTEAVVLIDTNIPM
jgi:hypothetical protein